MQKGPICTFTIQVNKADMDVCGMRFGAKMGYNSVKIKHFQQKVLDTKEFSNYGNITHKI